MPRWVRSLEEFAGYLGPGGFEATTINVDLNHISVLNGRRLKVVSERDTRI